MELLSEAFILKHKWVNEFMRVGLHALEAVLRRLKSIPRQAIELVFGILWFREQLVALGLLSQALFRALLLRIMDMFGTEHLDVTNGHDTSLVGHDPDRIARNPNKFILILA
jgi:hypothetical protein